ncbi:ABC transporter substrate-binding protein [Undibacterium cyanobacteriorum]|uniref:ABC transporter substrate-binding protein n=1 Tax=Undibacterium cyanobacteriorum TaxID=3073561 RepID=A0ABY9RKW2_9BURK|nr:ABC transporter substrate-binding protein [Undibacterium sp. 20NA77.5]WMW81339.1 ABC transporter substrate-binding protein [Undibacterium sp. 20NA77.5]
MLMTRMAAAQQLELRAYTEDWPPYNYQREGQVTGIISDILQEACHLEKIYCPMELVPWTRAYKNVQDNPNTLIYGIARIPAREHHFVWIGPILPRTTWVYVRANLASQIQQFSDLNRLRIGVIRGEASAEELVNAGVSKQAIIVFNSNTDVMRTFKSGKIDVLVNTEIAMAVNQQNFQIADEQVKRVMKVTDGGSIYLAMNIQSDPVLVEKLQTAVERMKREGKIQNIVQHYTKKNLQ